MNRNLVKFGVLAAVLSAGMLFVSACSEDDERVDLPTETAISDLVVVPEYRIDGVDQIPEHVFIQELFLGVGQIELEPLDGDLDIVYVSRDAVFLMFDVANGQLTLEGSPLVLPHAGSFRVSLMLQPVDAGTDEFGTSMQVNGLIAEVGSIHGGPGLVASGEPTPLPLHEGGEKRPVRWVPWTYRSERSALVRFDEVSFDNTEQQRLMITFDLSTWLDDAIAPITDNVIEQGIDALVGEGSNTDPSTDSEVGDRVDVSDDVDGRGNGIEELGGTTEAVAF